MDADSLAKVRSREACVAKTRLPSNSSLMQLHCAVPDTKDAASRARGHVLKDVLDGRRGTLCYLVLHLAVSLACMLIMKGHENEHRSITGNREG